MRIILGFLALFLWANSSMATEYIYRNLMANTLPAAKCETPEQAQKTALKPYKIRIYSKKFCQTQGYGWHLEEVKSTGDVTCNACEGTQAKLQKCHLKDVVVSCKRIKPGSVGMLPGKS